uniref:MFS domain-containing protein n=1 Tax=Globodera pallida TaxID=36090 RepID=A0A183CQR4_GLOPA
MLIGIMSTIMSCSYLLSSPIWGVLIEKKIKYSPKLITLMGSIMAIIAVSLMGPIPFIPITKTISTMCISFALLGMAASALYIPIFKKCSNVSKKLFNGAATVRVDFRFFFWLNNWRLRR